MNEICWVFFFVNFLKINPSYKVIVMRDQVGKCKIYTKTCANEVPEKKKLVIEGAQKDCIEDKEWKKMIQKKNNLLMKDRFGPEILREEIVKAL